MRLYHYTTKERHDAIIQSKQLKPSLDAEHDAVSGEGWYFTDLEPATCEKAIMVSCWRKTTLFQRIRYYLLFDIPRYAVRTVRDHIYLVPLDYGEGFHLVDHGENPECPDKPCSDCPQNALYE
jgi:hypothetical protein